MNMKKIISLIVLFACVLSSCSLEREYLNGPNAATFPNSKEEVEAGVFAAYKSLTQLSCFDTPFLGVQDNASDIGAARKGYAQTEDQQRSNIQLNNALVSSVYTAIYKIAGRVNLVLDGMETMDPSLMSEEDANAYRAELLLIRSYVYDLACQLWGDIPYITHSLNLDNAVYSRTPRAEVIESILNNDLKDELLDCLPVSFSKGAYGTSRLGRAGAYGLKARICLNWGKFEDAAKYADKALQLAAEAGYALTKYNVDFCGLPHNGIPAVLDEQGNVVEPAVPGGEPSAANLFGFDGYQSSNEIIWSMEYNAMIDGNTHNASYALAPRIAGGCSYWSPTQAFIDAIQCKDGKSIVESELYNWQKPWENRDPRLDLFCVRPGTRVYNIQFETNENLQYVMNYNTGKQMTNSEAYKEASKAEYGANGKKGPCGYLWRKYVEIDEYVNHNFSFNSKTKLCVLSYPLMRLSELYLIRAEALIECNKELGTAKSDIELVRAKADMPALTKSGQADLRSALRYERMVELCNEGFRWFDIRRWGIANKNMNGPLYAPAHDGSVSTAKPIIDENWHVTYSEASTWSNEGEPQKFNLRKFIDWEYNPEKDILWPIPEKELIAMPTVLQNNGYPGV